MSYITCDDLDTIRQYPKGLQSAGYWYVSEDQMADQARWLADHCAERHTQTWESLVALIFAAIKEDKTLRRANAPFCWKDLVDEAREREWDWIDQFEAEHPEAL